MKRIKLLLTISLLAVCVLVSSQPGFPGSRSVADSLMNEGNVPGAIKEFRKIYDTNPGNKRNVYNYACALSINKQIDSCLKYLNIAVKMDTSFAALTDPDLLSLREDSRWSGFEKNLISMLNRKNGNAIKDIEYAKSLWKLLCMDQYCFYETGIAVRKLGFDSPVVIALRRLQTMINERNVKELEILLAEKGWPKRSEVGQEAAGAAFFVLQHSNGDAQQKYVSMFEKMCKENEASWQQYALMFDRMRMNQNKPQRFGTHAYMDNQPSHINVLYPLEDETKADEWRKEIGLEPLKDYLARTGIKYVPSQGVKK